MGFGTAFNNLAATMSDCYKLPEAERDACMIAKGFRKTETGGYSKTTGQPLPELGKIAPYIPIAGPILVAGIRKIDEVKGEATPTLIPLAPIAEGTQQAGLPVLLAIGLVTILLAR